MTRAHTDSGRSDRRNVGSNKDLQQSHQTRVSFPQTQGFTPGRVFEAQFLPRFQTAAEFSAELGYKGQVGCRSKEQLLQFAGAPIGGRFSLTEDVS